MSPKGPPSFFSILQKNGCSKTPKGPPITFFGTMRLTGDQKNRKIFQKIYFFSHLSPPNAFETPTNRRKMNLIRTLFVLHLSKQRHGPVPTLRIPD